MPEAQSLFPPYHLGSRYIHAPTVRLLPATLTNGRFLVMPDGWVLSLLKFLAPLRIEKDCLSLFHSNYLTIEYLLLLRFGKCRSWSSGTHPCRFDQCRRYRVWAG